ncbi:unnamed protein product [Microthlaspi erraticum]|uniref:F-box domain-containing protein n=1 Tax=Microthlaspi erraticum TaxID=1685480 RepID=A0A6D2IUA3_9BRAS|nr:unnamed protein product [Microthlaspi erraticum]
MNMEEMKKSSSESHPPPTSFSSLPYEIVVSCLARISRIHRPTLSLVSKSFRSLIASAELDATRSRMGKTEECLYVCLDLNKNKPNPDMIVPRWYALAPIPKRQKLLPVSDLFPYQHPESSTIVSIGSEMYLIGGLVDGKRSRRMLFLESHRWRSLPDMIVPRERPAAEVIDGKIYVIGGCSKHWGEVYDPKTQAWEPLSPTTLDLTTQKSVVPGRLVMGGKVYEVNGLSLSSKPDICLAEIESNMWREIHISGSELFWRENEYSLWCVVEGLEKLSPSSYFPTRPVSVANSGGRRVTVWWKTVEYRRQGRHYTKDCKTDIWCAEISFHFFQIYGITRLRGCIEWSKSVYTYDGCDCRSEFFLHSAVVTH